MSYITIADVREDMMDRMAEDHLVFADLVFTDEDIEWAMKTCARKSNSIKPYVFAATYDKLPSATSVFFDGIAWALLRRLHRNTAMNDMDYQAGNVSASVQGSLNKNLAMLVRDLESSFISSLQDLKIMMNVNLGSGPVG